MVTTNKTPVHTASLQTDIRIGHLTNERTVHELEDRKDTNVLVVVVASETTGRSLF
jgi:phosphosulfolactate phosphohydrolase-like enzyme